MISSQSVILFPTFVSPSVKKCTFSRRARITAPESILVAPDTVRSDAAGVWGDTDGGQNSVASGVLIAELRAPAELLTDNRDYLAFLTGPSERPERHVDAMLALQICLDMEDGLIPIPAEFANLDLSERVAWPPVASRN